MALRTNNGLLSDWANDVGLHIFNNCQKSYISIPKIWTFADNKMFYGELVIKMHERWPNADLDVYLFCFDNVAYMTAI